jgi:hypothetical protein
LSGSGIHSGSSVTQTRQLAGAKAPAKHSVHPEKELVVVKFGTKLTVEDVERYVAWLREHPSFQPTFAEIVDLTGVEELDLGAEDFLKLADKVDPFSYEAKRAFVARSSVQNHAARMHKILRSQRNIEIFRSMEDAQRWIQS